MASWLATGEGGAQGLEKVLQQMIEEQQRQQQLDEATRHNRAGEENQSENMRLLGLYRQDTVDQRREAAKTASEDRDLSRDEKRAAMRPIGSSVPDEEAQAELKRGAVSRANFDWQPPNMGMSTEKGEVGPSTGGFSWRGTQDQIEKAKADERAKGATNTKNYNFNGHDIVAQETPQGRILYQGKDITDEPTLKPYVSPDRGLIQTGGGYMPRPEAARILAGGGDVPLATTGQTRAMSEGAQMLQPHVPELMGLATELDKRGMFGPVMGRVRDLAAKYGTAFDSGDVDQQANALKALGKDIANDPQLNTDELIGQFSSSLGLMASGAGRVHGGARGGGSAQMVEYFKSLLSGASTLPMFRGRMKTLDSYLSGYARGPHAATPEQAPPDDIYQQYLNRSKPKP